MMVQLFIIYFIIIAISEFILYNNIDFIIVLFFNSGNIVTKNTMCELYAYKNYKLYPIFISLFNPFLIYTVFRSAIMSYELNEDNNRHIGIMFMMISVFVLLLALYIQIFNENFDLFTYTKESVLINTAIFYFNTFGVFSLVLISIMFLFHSINYVYKFGYPK